MDEPFDLTEILYFLWKKKAIIIAITLIFALVPFIKFGIIDKPQITEPTEIEKAEEISYYYAQTTFSVKVTDAVIENSKDLDNLRRDLTELQISTYREMIKSQGILDKVINKLNLNINYKDLGNLISVARLSNSNIVYIIVANTDENQALLIANELLNEFAINIPSMYATEQVSVIDKAYILTDKDIANIFKSYIMITDGNEVLLNNLLLKLDIVKILPSEYLSKIFNEYLLTDNEIITSSSFNTIKNLAPVPATNNTVVDNPNTLRKVCIAGAIGFVLSAGCLVVIDFLSNTINNENYIDSKILATIDNIDNKDIFDILKIKLEQNKTILLTGANNSEKTDSIVNNLAKAFANNNKHVLLLDLVNNKSNIIKDYNGKGMFDLTNDLNNISKYTIKSNVNNLDVLLSGSENKDCVNENTLTQIVSSLESNYDYIIINSKNILEDANSLLLTKIVKNTVLLITERKTKLDTYNKSKESINDVNANLLGSILIK